MRRRPGLTGRLASFRYALSGLAELIWHEPNAQIHLTAAIGVLILATALGLADTDYALLFVAIALVWMAEAFNTAIERLADAVTIEDNPLIKTAKDVSAAAVLVASLAAAAIGTLVFGRFVW